MCDFSCVSVRNPTDRCGPSSAPISGRLLDLLVSYSQIAFKHDARGVLKPLADHAIRELLFRICPSMGPPVLKWFGHTSTPTRQTSLLSDVDRFLMRWPPHRWSTHCSPSGASANALSKRACAAVRSVSWKDAGKHHRSVSTQSISPARSQPAVHGGVPYSYAPMSGAAPI